VLLSYQEHGNAPTKGEAKMIKAGDKFIGSVDGMMFEVIEFRAARKNVGLRPDYVLRLENSNKTVSATESLLSWLLKSDSLVRAK
jgi:hypothetical protein